MLAHTRITYRQVLWLSLILALMLLLTTAVQPQATAQPLVQYGTVGRWSPPQPLANNGRGPILRKAPDGTIMIVYGQVATNGNFTPTYRLLLPDGSWSVPSAIHDQDGDENLSQVTVEFDSTSTAHAVWRNNSAVFYARQDNWTNDDPAIIFDNSPYQIFEPQIAVSNDNTVHVIATGNSTSGGPQNIFYRFSNDRGDNWDETVEPLATFENNSTSPALAADANGNVHVVWEEWVDVNNDGNYVYLIHHKTGTRTGSGFTWSTVQTISDPVINARRPAILADGNTLHVTFTDRISAAAQFVYYIQRPADSLNWTTPQDITEGNPLAVNTNVPFDLASKLTMCGDSLHTFFYGSPVFNTNEQVYLQESKNGNWRTRELVTDSNDRRVRPSAVCHNNALHLVYEEIVTPNVNHQIYFTAALEQLYLPIIVRN